LVNSALNDGNGKSCSSTLVIAESKVVDTIVMTSSNQTIKAGVTLIHSQHARDETMLQQAFFRRCVSAVIAGSEGLGAVNMAQTATASCCNTGRNYADCDR